jgi:hypothetical protein
MGGKPTPQTSQRVQLGCGACSTWLKPYKASVGQTSWTTGATAPAQHQLDGSADCAVSGGAVAEGHCGTTK